MKIFNFVQIFNILISLIVLNSADSSEEGPYFFYQTPAYPRDCKEVQEQCTTQTASGVYLIKPEGYGEAFEVYCDNDLEGGGWTVFQRRSDDNTVDFRRTFSEYRNGFGFLGGEFWLGNERLSYLTNQKRYELRIDMVNTNGSSFYVTYNLFRISDEWSSYKLTSVGHYDGTADDFITPYPKKFSDCYDVFTSGFTEDGVYTITPTDWTESPYEVYCNMSHDGGWMVLQRRVNGSVDFYRYWDDYKEGFGNPDHELWLGNEKLFFLTNQRNYKLRIDFVNGNGVPYYMNYDLFRLSNEDSNYQLELGSYTGNAGYDYMIEHRDRPFTTRDRDNDRSNRNCAEDASAAWWFSWCYSANLNGVYSDTGSDGITLYKRDGDQYQYELSYTQMKIRPV